MVACIDSSPIELNSQVTIRTSECEIVCSFGQCITGGVSISHALLIVENQVLNHQVVPVS